MAGAERVRKRLELHLEPPPWEVGKRCQEPLVSLNPDLTESRSIHWIAFSLYIISWHIEERSVALFLLLTVCVGCIYICWRLARVDLH